MTLDTLAICVGELRRVTVKQQHRNASLPPIESSVDDAIYRRFFMAAIAVVLTAGATWGAWMLYRIGVAHSFTGISIFQVNAHGHAQIFGWVGLFIMGFAYQAFPRKWQTRLVGPQIAVAVFFTMLAGLILKTIGLAAPDARWSAGVALAGGIAEEIAVCVFAVQIIQTFRGSMSSRLDPWVGYIFAALVFFVVQAAFDTWHSWTTMTASSQQQLLWYVATYQAPLRDLQMHGMALLMILGVNQRLLPGLYNRQPVPRRRSWVALALLVTAVAGEAILFAAYRWTGNHVLAAFLLVPWMMLAIGIGMIALPWKLWRPLKGVDGQTDRCGKFIRMAYAWLALSLVMLLFLPGYLAISKLQFSHAYYGAIRHAFTVGFISLMIMGFAAKVVSALNGIDPRTLTKLRGPFILINIGCCLRVTLQTLTDWNPHAFSFVGISGVLEVTALAWWGIGLMRIMSRGKRAIADRRAEESSGRFVAITSNNKLATTPANHARPAGCRNFEC